MAAIAKWQAYSSVTGIAGTSLNGIASGTAAVNYVLGAAIDNTPASAGYFLADFELNLSSAVTAGTGSPFLAVYLIPSFDGTNYATTNGGTTAGPTSAAYFVGSIVVPASTAAKVLQLRGFVLPPCNFKVMINNQLGVALPATTTSTCTLYRYSEQSV